MTCGLFYKDHQFEIRRSAENAGQGTKECNKQCFILLMARFFAKVAICGRRWSGDQNE